MLGVLIVAVDVKVVGAVVVHVPGKSIAHIAARLIVDFMSGVGRNSHVGIQFQRTRPGFIRRQHLGQVAVGVAVKGILKTVPHQQLAVDPGVGPGHDDRIVFKQLDHVHQRDVFDTGNAIGFEDFIGTPRRRPAEIGLYEIPERGGKILRAFNVPRRQAFEPADLTAQFNISGKFGVGFGSR